MDYSDVYPVKRAKISHGGDPVQQAIVAAVSGKSIVVLSYVLTGTADGTGIWESASTDLTGAMHFQEDGGCQIVAPHNPKGWLATTAGEALNITSSGIAINGHVNYVEVG